MSNYDRFKPTSTAQAKERKNEVAAAVWENENNQDGKVKKMNVKKDGIYKIRMYPAHPSDGALSIEPKLTYFIPGMRKKKDAQGNIMKDNGGNDLWEQYNRPVYDSRVHGYRNGIKCQFDLVNSYIDLTAKQAKVLHSDSEAQKNYLLPLTGNKFQGGTFNGLKPNHSFLFYGDLYKAEGDKETKEFFEFEVGKAVEKGIQSTAAIENNNDPLGTDGCFTDISSGLPMKIIVDKVGSQAAKDPSLYYKVSLITETEKEIVNGRSVSVVKEYPLTNEILDWYEAEVPALIEYREAFTRKDLEIQLKGLQIFDEEHGYGILDTEEFKEVWNELDKWFPETEDSQNSNEGGSTNNTKQSSEDEFDLMEMNELKSFIKSNGLGIVVLPSMTIEQVREVIRITLNDVGTDESETTTSSEEVEEQQEEEAPNETAEEEAMTEEAEQNAPQKTNYKDRIASLTGKVS